MRMITDLLITALYTVFAQNLVLSSGLGMSEAIRVSTRPGTFGKFALMISGFSVVTSTLCSLIDSVPSLEGMTYAVRAAIYAAVLTGVYIITAAVMRFVFGSSPKVLGTLGIAAVLLMESSFVPAICLVTAALGLYIALYFIMKNSELRKLTGLENIDPHPDDIQSPDDGK